MSDLLDVPPAPSRATRRRRKKAPRLIGVLVVLVLLVVLVGGAALAVGKVKSHFQSAPDYTGSGSGTAVVQVKAGDTAYNLALRLVQMDVVKSAAAFRKVAAKNPNSAKLQPGYYQLHEHMSAAAALTLLLDPKARLQGHVTIPEGMPLAQALPLIAKNTEVKLSALKAAAANPAALGLPSYANGTLEGFLFPATYDIEPGTSAVEVLTMMVNRFEEAADAVDLEGGARALGLTPYQALIVASLTEKEAGVDADFPKVARVVYNRLAAGMPLQFDSTINYVRAERAARLSIADISVNSPYNSYNRKGLPPTPIDAPGQRALEAALHPADGDWIYFITIDKQGNSLFTKSYNEFLKAKAKAQREGVY